MRGLLRGLLGHLGGWKRMILSTITPMDFHNFPVNIRYNPFKKLIKNHLMDVHYFPSKIFLNQVNQWVFTILLSTSIENHWKPLDETIENLILCFSSSPFISYSSFSFQHQFKNCLFLNVGFKPMFFAVHFHFIIPNIIYMLTLSTWKNNHNKQTQSSKHSPLICKHHHSNIF